MDYELKLNEGEVNTVLAGLGELPAKSVYTLINKIQMQAQEQQKAEEAKERRPVVTHEG